ncbi:hypothetical protein HMPREF0666_01732 [Prevotella sp. C561]|uniref:hypothetical protein n=1 Tax=Prevotella sp. C561 TaxID=563031 RepID=UPI000223743B|nr:hypothetical protein [Prevotella sp. C561]EGW47159.1 hypothetical protein HMPREF0666_01732 [Prevotella sp. C561]
MRVKKLLVIALMAFPMMGMAQSSYEQKSDSANTTQFENKQNSAVYQQWLSQYEECGRQINTISEQYQREVEKRGYPKKKTVKAKIALVNQYIGLLQQQRDSPELNQGVDLDKVNSKITMWQEQLAGLTALLKKI